MYTLKKFQSCLFSLLHGRGLSIEFRHHNNFAAISHSDTLESQTPTRLLLYSNLVISAKLIVSVDFNLQAMLEINEHMHKIWKRQVEEKSLQSSIASWIRELPVDSNIKEWVAEEERYKQEVHMQNILPAVADKFLVNCRGGERGASILCFDEIQVTPILLSKGCSL